MEGAEARGRIVRLGPVAERVISGHGYRGDAARLAGEALTIVSLLGSSLKFEGTLTLQTRGDGRATMVVADFVTPGHVRKLRQRQTRRRARRRCSATARSRSPSTPTRATAIRASSSWPDR
ncbi:MAG: Hsp33 family molecular chaperone HslO [Alphaproteobacteria bacterium]